MGPEKVPVTAMCRRRPFDFVDALVICAFVVGAAFCVIAVMHKRSLWVDEAMLALNVATRSFGELTRPLDQLQMAPVLFLWSQRAAIAIGGVTEHMLRLVPLLCGIATLPLMFLVARRIVSRFAAALAVCVLAVSPMVIYYSGEAKPYAGDMFTALALLWLALRSMDEPAHAVRWRSLLLGGIVAPWFSFTAMFLLPMIGLALGVPERAAEGFSQGNRVRRRRAMLALAAWGASALASLFIARDSTIGHEMNLYWQGEFLTLGFTGARRAAAFTGELVQFAVLGLRRPAAPGSGSAVLAGVASALVSIGAVVLAWRGRLWALLIGGPLVAAFAASVAALYPAAARLWLFAVPLVVLLFVIGVDSLARLLPAVWRGAVALAIGALFVVPGLRSSLRLSRSPELFQHAQPVVNALLANLRDGEPVYVFAGATPVWLFYSTDWRRDTAALRPLLLAGSPPNGPAFNNAATAGRLTPETERILTRRIDGRVEVLGVSSGYRIAYRATRTHVAAEWAPAEVARMMRTGSPCVMLFFVHVRREEDTAMLAELRRVGAEQRWRFDGNGSKALRICFDKPSAPA